MTNLIPPSRESASGHIARADGGVPVTPTADHHGVQPRRLHGGDAGPTERLVATRSRFDPGAWVDPGPVTGETLYVLLAGELSMEIADRESTVLNVGDSAYLPKGTVRSLRSGRTGATLLVVRNP
jgi:mannose-6-phosphate isomerase-like protein (cupin superfamily)